MNNKQVILHRADIHSSCVCYQKGDARTIRRCELGPVAGYSLHLDSHHMIFVLDGEVRLTAHNVSDSVSLSEDDFIFLPISTKIELDVAEGCSLLFFKLDELVGQIPECDTFRFQRAAHPETFSDGGLYPMKINGRIKHFIEGVISTDGDGLKCGSYAKLLVGQLLFMVQVYYPQDEYTRFYSPVLSPDVVFSEFVVKHWREYMSVTDMAEAMNMTGQRFSARFRKVFGKTPGAWFLERKAEYIYHDVCSSHKPLKTIALDYRFSMPNFIRFCRTNFGMTPSVIRKKLNDNFACTPDAATADAGPSEAPENAPCAIPGGNCRTSGR